MGKFSRIGDDEVVGGAISKALTYNIKKAHELLGHNNENDTRQMASHLGWTITRGPLGVCETCANAKASQKNVPKILLLSLLSNQDTQVIQAQSYLLLDY